MRRFLLPLAAALLSAPAHAQIFSVNDAVFGPDALTVDQTLELAFLDLTLTQGQTPTEIMNRMTSGGDLEGFRYANISEITTFLAAIGFEPKVPNSFGSFTGFPAEAGTEALNLLGATASLATGGFSDGAAVEILVSVNEISGNASVDVVAAGTSNPSLLGHWLVREPGKPVGVVYQGRITQDGAPVAGPVDLQMRLVDGLNAPISPLDTRSGVLLNDGLFALELFFDDQLLSRQDAKIEIFVSNPAGSGNPFEVLGPPQPIAVAPRAIAAQSAVTAESAVMADAALVADAISNTQTQDIVLASQIVPYGNGYRTPQWTRIGNMVTLTGLIRNLGNITASNKTVAQLPSPIWPTERLIFAVPGDGGMFRVDVLTNGQLVIGPYGAAPSTMTWMSFDGISYQID